MPDVTLVVRDLGDGGEAERLERALTRLEAVKEANVDPTGGLVAVSYEGGGSELRRIEEAVEEAGYTPERSPGAGRIS